MIKLVQLIFIIASTCLSFPCRQIILKDHQALKPNKDIIIYLQECGFIKVNQDSVLMMIDTFPGNKNETDVITKINYYKSISKIEFDNLYERLLHLNYVEILAKKDSTCVLDGKNYSILFGTQNNLIRYSTKYSKHDNNLDEFMNIFNDIINLSNVFSNKKIGHSIR